MTTPPLKNFVVVGSGQMGIGVGIVAAIPRIVTGGGVCILDKHKSSLEKGAEFVRKWVNKEVSKGNTEIYGITEIIKFCELKDEPLVSADIVVECAPECYNAKKAIFENLSRKTRSDCILATNTSSISISRIANGLQYPERVIGMHFMNPVPVMNIVELIRGELTGDFCFQKVCEEVISMGKTYAVSIDTPGFIANRILMPYINEAIICVEHGVGSPEDIDTLMKKGTQVPMGPLSLADFIGLDTCLSIIRTLHENLGDKYIPSTLLVRMVDGGRLGKKVGRGFFKYR